MAFVVAMTATAGCRGKGSEPSRRGRGVPAEWIGLEQPGDARSSAQGFDVLAALPGDGSPTDATGVLAVTPPPATIAVGERHSCWIRPDRRVVCWGENDMGQVNGRPGPIDGPRLVPGVTAAVEVRADRACSCARTAERRVLCWGDCAAARLEDRPSRIDSRDDAWWEKTAAGFGCSISQGRQLACSRDGSAGSARRDEDLVDFPGGVEEAAVSSELVCLRDVRGNVACLTETDRGERPEGGSLWSSRPVPALGGAARLVAGAGMICALKSSGAVACVASRPGGGVAVFEVALADAQDLAARIAFCATRKDEPAVCWGVPAPAEDGSLPEHIDPVEVAGSKGLTSIAVDEIACASDDAGTLYCWDVSELAGGGRVASLGSLGVAGIAGAVEVAVRADVACVRDTAGVVLCRRPADDAALPVPGVTGVLDLVAVHEGFCALRTGGWLSCWPPDNPVAEADVFTASVARLVPQDVAAGPPGAVVLAAMGDEVCVRGPGGPPWNCLPWTLQDAHRSPVAVVPGLPDPVQLTVGGDGASCAVPRGGGVLCWSASGGYPKAIALPGSDGAVAVARWESVGPCALHPAGAVTCRRSGPEEAHVRVAGLDGAPTRLCDGFGRRACALMRDGTVRCWEDAAPPDVPPPTASVVPGVEGAVAAAVGETHACAVLGDGAVACWGDDNRDGRLGRSPSDGPGSPAPVADLPAAAEIAAGVDTTCIVAEGGAVWCWGPQGDSPDGWRPRRVEGLFEAR